MHDLPDAAKRVQAEADRLGLTIAVRVMPESTRTAEEAAAACGCAVGQIIKSLIFKGKESGRPYLLLVSGANRVNEETVPVALGEQIVRPDAAYVREVTGFAIGGIPPFGHVVKIGTWLDEDLLQYGTVWAAAGTPRTVFAVNPGHLRDSLHARVIVTR